MANMSNIIKLVMFLLANWKQIYSLIKQITDIVNAQPNPAAKQSKTEAIFCQLSGICKVQK